MDSITPRLVEIAGRQHQVFSRQQARGAGASASLLSRRLATGRLVACGTSALHLPGVSLTYRGRLMAGLLDLGSDALVSGRSAAHLLGLDGFEEGPLEFLVPRQARGRRTAGVVSSTHEIARLDRIEIEGLACTSATRTIVELLDSASEDEVGNALDSATRQRLTAPSVVVQRLDDLGRRRHGGAVLERLLRAGTVESWLERRFLALARRSGLPPLVLQRRYEAHGVVARVDFEFLDAPIVVEVGGRRGYLSRDERQRQERRRNALQLAGRTIYFFTRDDVVDDPQYVTRTLCAALNAARVG